MIDVIVSFTLVLLNIGAIAMLVFALKLRSKVVEFQKTQQPKELNPKTPTANERWVQEQEHLLYGDKPPTPYRHTACRACGPGPLKRNEVPSIFTHVFYKDVLRYDAYGSYTVKDKVSSPSRAEVVSSEIEGENTHSIMLDIDMPARLIESSTPGHHHLYIDKKLTWLQYKRLLRALNHAGVIERGYYKSSVSHKGTHLRVPWLDKEHT